MNNIWISTFALFLLIDDNSSEIFNLLNAQDFDAAFDDILNEAINTDAIIMKDYIISKLKDKKEKLRSINNTFKQIKLD